MPTTTNTSPPDPPPSLPSTPTNQSTPPETTTTPSSLLSPRSGRQFALYAISSTLLTLSILSTRRALLRRYASTAPAFFQPSFPEPLIHLNLRKEAAEALRLATYNVLGFGAVAVSGGLWAADISGMGELKAALGGLKKKRVGVGERDREKDGEVEREFEDFLGPSLRRGVEKEQGKR